MDPWKTSIYNQLKQRNRWQRDHYQPIIEAYAQLLSSSRAHRARSYELEQELSNIRTSLLTGRSPTASTTTIHDLSSPDGHRTSLSFSARSSNLEEKVLKLQEELTAAYRLQSENSSTFLRLKEQAEKDEKALLAKEEEFTKQSILLKSVQEERDQHIQRIKFMETTIDILRKEVESSRAVLLATENKYSKLETENSTLVDQLLRIKADQASQMNQMNDLVSQATREKEEAARRASEVKQQIETKHAESGVSVDMDMSNANSIIDHVAWQSNFNVTIPNERKRTVRAHRGQVTCVRYNAKGTVLISGGTDGMVKVYDAFRGVCKGSLKGAKESVMNVCISSDDQMVLGAGNDKTARIWALKTGREMHTLLGHTNKIYAAAFSADNTKVVTGSHDRTIRVWDLALDGACKRTIMCQSSCNYLSLAPNGNVLASAHMDNHIRFWSLNTGELQHDLGEIHTQQATSCEFSRDGSMIISNSRDSILKLIDVRTFKVIKSLEGTAKEPYRNAINWNRACFSPDSQYVIAGAASGSIFIWNVDTGKIVSILPPAQPSDAPPTDFISSSSSSTTIPETSISCVDWNRNGRQLVSADNTGCIHFWE